MKNKNTILLIALLIAVTCTLNAQKKSKKNKQGFIFTAVKEIKTTSIKDQYKTNTCWSFATNSFIETELIRMGNDPIDLSEMYIIRNTYPSKALNYIRMHGETNFGAGGQAHDDMDVIRNFGFVPESIYPGLWDDLKLHDHTELEFVLSSYLDGVLKQKDKKLSTRWLVGFNGILDAYLGDNIEEFEFNGEKYTPQTFATDYLKFNPDEYVEITSYTHHPYYESFILEVPDNWTHNLFYNVPIEELIQIIDHAIENDFSVCWDGDVSERTFSNKRHLAFIPEKQYQDMTDEEKDELFKNPVKERIITQKMRQETFNNMTTTDDHLMHIVGKMKDQNGTIYYNTKNSWGDSNDIGGYVYISESYIKLKTIAIMVHKDAISEEIKEKLKL